MPYDLVMPSMELGEDGYVLHMDESELIQLATAVGDVLETEIASQLGDSN